MKRSSWILAAAFLTVLCFTAVDPGLRTDRSAGQDQELRLAVVHANRLAPDSTAQIAPLGAARPSSAGAERLTPAGSARLTPEQEESVKAALRHKRARLETKLSAMMPGGKSGPDPFSHPRAATEFYLKQRLAPGQDQLPLEQMHAELEQIKAREAAQLASQRAAKKSGGAPPGAVRGWQAIGPGNIGGRTRAIVIDPGTPGVMYAGGVAGGVWKSTDAGLSWNPTGDLMLNMAICSLAIDPVDTSVLYAGTGELFSGSPFLRGLGIFKSVDAGASWTQLPGTVSGVPEGAFHYVNDLVISPNDHNRVYAATRFGVWRSLDAGQSWSIVLRNPNYIAGSPSSNGCSVGCTDLDVRTDRNPDALFAAFGVYQSDGLFRSDNGGDSWVTYTTESYQGRMAIAIAPSNNDVIYLTMADNGGLNGYGRIVSVFRADDGVNFSSVLDFGHPFSQWLFSYLAIATGCYEHPVIYSQGWYDNIIAVDPLDEDRVWVGGIDLYRSDDGGRTFGLSDYWFYPMEDPLPTTYLHVDQHEITFHPDYNGSTNQVMYVGNDGGIWRTANARAATSQEECPIGPDPGPPPEIVWESMNNGYQVTQFYHGDSGVNAQIYVGGAQDNGSSRAWSTATPDGWKMIFGGDGGYVAVDPTDNQHFFVEIQGFPTIEMTVDGGETFTEAVNGITDTDGMFITPFTMDPSDPQVLWTGGSRPWRTMDGAALWEPAGPNFSGPANISAIAVAPSNGNVVYLGFNNGYVARTPNALTGTPLWDVSCTGLPVGWISSLAVDPLDPDTAYCSYSTIGVQHIFRTTDGGDSWTPIDGIEAVGVPDIPVHCVAVHPSDGQQLYAGTEFGVFASGDGGASWAPANDGLAHTVVEALDFIGQDTVVAYTHGRGAFITELGGGSTVGAAFSCTPPAGKLPFPVQFTARLDNMYPDQLRRIAARIDARLAGGTFFPSWRAGFTNVASGGSFNTSWTTTIPALGSVIGDNTFSLAAEDVTPPPYNQPPYPPAGDTATDQCTVTGIAP